MAATGNAITRRDFMRAGACLAAGGLVGLPFAPVTNAQGTARSRKAVTEERKKGSTMVAEDHLNLCVNDFIASEIIRSMSDALLVFDFRGRVLSINPAAMELLNLAWEDIRGKTYADLFLSDALNAEFNETLLGCVRDRQTQMRKEVSFRRSDGRFLDLAVTTSLLRREGFQEEEGGVVMVMRDISDFKALDRARQRVLDHLSHELKTPLSIIKASLKEEAAKSDAAMRRIQRSLKRLYAIQTEVEDIVRHREFSEKYPFKRWLGQILDLAESLAEKGPSCAGNLQDLRARIEDLFSSDAQDKERARAHLKTCLHEVLQTAKKDAAHRKLEFPTFMEEDPEVPVDPVLLEKVLMAPLKNAIENTPDGGSITVSLTSAVGKAQVEIRDTGVGITAESRKQIFGGFYHARDTNYYSTKRPFDFGAGGKGLDLLRLRIFADIYGFQIEVESERCGFIPEESDLCPGDTEKCPHIRTREECAASGGTVFRLLIPCT